MECCYSQKCLLPSAQTKHKVQCRLLLDVVVLQCASIFELLAGEDEALLVWGDTLLVLDLGLHSFNCVGAFHLQCDGFAGESLHEDLHSSAQTKHKVQCRLLLDV